LNSGLSPILTAHSSQAYSIIKTIHLMNSANADTLTPVSKYNARKRLKHWIPCEFFILMNPKEDFWKYAVADDRRM
jgi:hypothetical protein